MALFSDLKTEKNGQAVFKPVDALVAVAPYTTAALTKNDLFDSTTGAPKVLPTTGWVQLGWFTTDGLTFSVAPTISDTQSFGSLEPIRRTVTAETTTLALTPQEQLRTVQALYHMASLTAVTPDTHNVVNWQKPALPVLRDYRLIAIGVDTGQTAGEWIKAIQFPRASIVPNGDSSWNQDDAGSTLPLIATAQIDGTLGYAVEFFEGAAGFPATALGFA